jgi:hypothetical protein
MQRDSWRRFSWLALLLLPGYLGCIDVYDGFGTCTYCKDGQKKTATVEVYGACTKGDAQLALETACKALGEGGVVDPSSITKEEALDQGQCDSSSKSPLTPDTARSLNGLIDSFRPRPAAPQKVTTTDDGEFCEVPDETVSFTVTVFNEYRPYNTCPDAKEMQVRYNRYLSDDETETVILSASVPFGGSHEFTVDDCVIEDSGFWEGKGVAAVLAQAYDASGFPDCTVIPIEDGAFQASYGLLDNQQLTIHEHPETGGLIHTITGPDARVNRTAAKAKPVELKPIPDPKFTRGR